MTPIDSTYSIAVDSKLDWEALGRILATGHSRIPVHSGDSKNLIGLLLVKNLITVRAEDEMPVSAMSIRRLPCVSADTPLYDMLNEFQKGQSHMAAVVSVADKKSVETADNNTDVPLSCDHPKDNIKALPEYSPTYIKDSNIKGDEYSPTYIKDSNGGVELDPAMNCPDWKVNILHEGSQTCCKLDKTNLLRKSYAAASEEGEVIGIITLEDVFEELIQEEIVDETDEYVDVHKRIRVTNGSPPPLRGSAWAGLSTNGRPRSAKLGGKSSSKLKNLPLLNGGYNMREPLLDKYKTRM